MICYKCLKIFSGGFYCVWSAETDISFRNVSYSLMSDTSGILSQKTTSVYFQKSLDVTGLHTHFHYARRTTNTYKSGQLSAYLHDLPKLHSTKDETRWRLSERVTLRTPMARGIEWRSLCFTPCCVPSTPLASGQWAILGALQGLTQPFNPWPDPVSDWVLGEVRRVPHASPLVTVRWETTELVRVMVSHLAPIGE